jgi:sigma-B regulation protein RsbU (phosphoserine phosphatase)
MSYARAGHPPLLIQHANTGGKPVSITPKGLALGIVEGAIFSSTMEEMTLELAAGDRLLIFTDGLLDAMDKDRNFYGMDRLLKIISGQRTHDPEMVLQRILEDVRVFTRNEPYHDDLTMLAMEVKI